MGFPLRTEIKMKQNKKNSMKSKLYNRIAAALLLITGIMMTGNGCDALIYEDMLDCPQGVYLKFYTKTPCDTDTIYPADISNLNVFVFDENDRFVADYTEENVTLSSGYEMLIPIYPHGKYSFVAWANVDNHYEMKNLQQGTTTKENLLLQLKQSAGMAVDLKGETLYAGTSDYVFLPDPESVLGAFYEHTSIRLTQYVNRIDVIVEGFAVPQDYKVEITMRNGDYAVNGDILLNGDAMQYPPEYSYGDSTLTAKFNTLKLETGYDDWLTLKGKEDEVLYHEDLLGTLLLQNPDVNLSCDHDFVIRFKVKENDDTYVVTEVWVNDWLIHSYDTEIDSDY